jgi:hypothetical protein
MGTLVADVPFEFAATAALNNLQFVQKVGAGTVNGNGSQVITINAVMWVPVGSLPFSTWIKVATVPLYYRPSNTVYWALPNEIDATQFGDIDGLGMYTQFTGNADFLDANARVKANGDLDVHLTPSATANLPGVGPVVIIPLHITYFYSALT